jgi:uncharacterized membrane protein (DUF4010 family)
MGRRAAAEPRLRSSAVAAAVAATVSTIVLNGIVLGALSGQALIALVPVLAPAGLVAVGCALLAARAGVETTAGDLDLGRAFDLKTPVVLAALLSAVLLATDLLGDVLGDNGLVLVAGVAGFADAQAATASAASLVADGRIEPAAAALPVLVALTTNSLTKTGLALALGGTRFALPVGAGLVVVLAAAWAGWLLA